MLNFYQRASRVASLLNDTVALKVLLELYPNKKINAERLSRELGADTSDILQVFEELEKNNLITNNPSSGNKVLTEEGIFFLEQTATVFPKLKEFLDEQRKEV